MKCECGETNPDNFSVHNRSKTGYQKLCKACFRKMYWASKPRKYDGISCEVDGCCNQAVTKNLCRKHYKQVYTYGTTYEGSRRKWKAKPKPIVKPVDSIPWPATTSPILEVK